MFLRKFILPAYLCLSCFVLNAQQLLFKNYSIQDGLVTSAVRNVFQDKKGFIWIATWEGLSKYDGYRFTNYTTDNGLSHSLVNDLWEDGQGRLYVALNNGDIDMIENGRIHKTDPGFRATVNGFFHAKSGIIYVATDEFGFMQFHNGKLIKIPSAPPGSVDFFAELNDSMLVIGGAGTPPRIVNRRFETIAESAIDNIITHNIYRDRHNRVWISTYKGLQLVDPVQQKGKPMRLLPLPPSFNIPALQKESYIYSMLEDNNGNFWFCALNNLVKIHPNGKAQLLTTKDGLPSNLVYHIFPDRENNFWISSQGGLTKIISSNNIQAFTTRHGIDEVVDILPVDSTSVYLTNSDAVQKFNTSDYSLSVIRKGADAFGRFERSGNNIIGLANSYITNFDPSSATTSKLPVSGGFAAAADQKGTVFIGTNIGIHIRYKNRIYIDHTLPFRIQTLVFDNDGYLWAGSWDRSLYRLKIDYTRDTFQCHYEDMGKILPYTSFRSSFKDKGGNLWFGTRYNGLVRLKKQPGGSYTSLFISQKDGLISNWINSIAEDENGNIWVGSYIGIDKLIPQKDSYRVFQFSRINNMPGTLVNQIVPVGNRLFWCAAYPGLIRFKDELADTLKAPPIYITQVRVGKKGDPTDSILQQSLSLHHNQNLLQFEFSSPSFINEKQIQYSYRLAGSNDTSWSRPENNHTVLYASLQPGNYRFEVRALGWNGEWGNPAVYSFTIRPPFWKTWWFIAICILLLGVLGWIVYRYRINQLMKLQRVRNRIASDLHDDIGSSLNNINLLSELSNRNISRPVQAQTFIKRISEEVNTSSQALDDIVWSINANNDSLEQVVARMRRYASEIFDASNISYTMRMGEGLADRKLNMEQRRDLFLIFKEVLNNIYKHAQANHVEMNLEIARNQLRLSIKDDGKGFDPGISSNRNGIRNIKHRTEKWSGKINIDSKQGIGTRMEINMPVAT